MIDTHAWLLARLKRFSRLWIKSPNGKERLQEPLLWKVLSNKRKLPGASNSFSEFRAVLKLSLQETCTKEWLKLMQIGDESELYNSLCPRWKSRKKVSGKKLSVHELILAIVPIDLSDGTRTTVEKNIFINPSRATFLRSIRNLFYRKVKHTYWTGQNGRTM